MDAAPPIAQRILCPYISSAGSGSRAMGHNSPIVSPSYRRRITVVSLSYGCWYHSSYLSGRRGSRRRLIGLFADVTPVKAKSIALLSSKRSGFAALVCNSATRWLLKHVSLSDHGQYIPISSCPNRLDRTSRTWHEKGLKRHSNAEQRYPQSALSFGQINGDALLMLAYHSQHQATSYASQS